MAESKKFNAWLPDFGTKGWGITIACFVFFYFYSFCKAATKTLFCLFNYMY